MLTAGRGTVTIFRVVSYLYSEGKINLHTNLDLTCIGLLSQDKLALSLHIKAPSFYPWPDYDEAVHKNPYEI